MPTKYTFLDTDVFLHYKPLDQIDWLRELGVEHIVLFIAPVVLRQLNDKKDGSESRKLRKRAGASLKRLDAYLGQDSPVMLRNGVELRFLSGDPLLDFSFHGLSRQVLDDWLIATVIEFAAQSPERDAVIVSGDVGLKVKAKCHNIVARGLDESYRLPEEEDAVEKRNRELEEQLRRQANVLPVLKLTFDDDAEYARITLTRPPTITDTIVAEKLTELRQKYPKIEGRSAQSFADALTQPSPEMLSEYNQELENYFVAYGKYLWATEKAVDAKHREFEFDLYLENTGGSPGEDVDIYVHYPDGLDVLKETQLIQLPPEPVPPTRRLGMIDLCQQLKGVSFDTSRFDSLLNAGIARQPTFGITNVSSPSIRKSNSYEVRQNVKSIKHGFVEDLGKFYVRFSSWDTVNSFSIKYALYASNLPTETGGTLHLVVGVKES